MHLNNIEVNFNNVVTWFTSDGGECPWSIKNHRCINRFAEQIQNVHAELLSEKDTEIADISTYQPFI